MSTRESAAFDLLHGAFVRGVSANRKEASPSDSQKVWEYVVINIQDRALSVLAHSTSVMNLRGIRGLNCSFYREDGSTKHSDRSSKRHHLTCKV